MGIPHSQGARVCPATVIPSAACMRAVTTRASVPARMASLGEIAPSVPPAMSHLQGAASVCDVLFFLYKILLPPPHDGRIPEFLD